MEKRKVAEMNATRDAVYVQLEGIEIEGHKFLGRAVEGLVYENAEGLAIVIRVIAKANDFDAEDAVSEYEEKADAKVKKEAEKAEKVAKAKAKKEKEKGE